MTAIDETASLDERYGRTPKQRRRSRNVYLVGGVFGAIVVVAWVVWAGLGQSGASIASQDSGATIVNSRTVDISWQVSMDVGRTASCALQVQANSHAIVGWKIVHIPAQTKYTTFHHATVRSAQQPVTGLIYSCWLT